MEVRVLEYFLAVSRERSISGAAEALHLTQPTLSRQIKELEDELGKTLVIRGSRRITLTEEGMLLRKRAEELGLVISQTHGRIEGFKNIKEEDDALVANARLDCLATATLGAPYCIIHSVTSIFMGPAPDRQLMQDLNFDMFNRMIPFAKQYGIKLSSETFGDAMKYDEVDFFGQIDQFIMSYNRICAAGDNAKYMSVCVDTGHSNKASRFGQPSPADVIRMLGSNVKTLHLNDNNKLVDQHKIPLTGCIDWEDTLNALDEIGYDGVFNMELALNNCGGKGMEFESAVYANQVMKNLLKLRGWEVE